MTKITTAEAEIEHPAEGGTPAWTEKVLTITVTPRTPDDMRVFYVFTNQQNAALDELLTAANREMWNSLLYGSSGEIVAVALSQVGNVGGQPYWSWYGFNSRVEWCACFVSWCANECGYIDAGVIPKFAGCVGGSKQTKTKYCLHKVRIHFLSLPPSSSQAPHPHENRFAGFSRGPQSPCACAGTAA